MGVSASDLGPRLLGLCLLLPLVVMVLAGGGWLLAACLFVAFMMIAEFALLILSERSQQALLIVSLSALVLGSYLAMPVWFVWLLSLLAGGLVWRLSNRLSALFCLLVIACLSMLFALVQGPEGRALLILLALVIAAVDSGAWLTGRLLGGPKLALKISPGKTWSGLQAARWRAVLPGILLPAGCKPGPYSACPSFSFWRCWPR